MKGVRTFLGIFPPPEIQSKIADVQSSFNIDGSGVRWELQSKFHVTLRFLGDVAEKRLQELQVFLHKEAATIPPFETRLLRVGCFPSDRSPKIVWIGSSRDENAELVRCFSAIDTSCTRAGFKKEERVFHPHITLGRVKGKVSENLIKLIENTTFEPLKFPCTELLVMKSDLSPSGSTYSKQCSISLKH